MSLMKDFCESDPSLKASTKVSQIIIKLFKCDVQFKGGERWSRCMDEDEKVIQLVMIGWVGIGQDGLVWDRMGWDRTGQDRMR